MANIIVKSDKIAELSTYISSFTNNEYVDSNIEAHYIPEVNSKSLILALLYSETGSIHIDLLYENTIRDLNFLGMDILIEKILKLPIVTLLDKNITSRTEYLSRFIMNNYSKKIYMNNAQYPKELYDKFVSFQINDIITSDLSSFIRDNCYNSQDDWYTIPYILACYAKNSFLLDLFKNIIYKSDFDINMQAYNRIENYILSRNKSCTMFSLLTAACFHGNEHTFNILINHPNIDINKCFVHEQHISNDVTPLIYAVKCNNINITKSLLTHPNINPNIVCNEYNGTAFYCSCEKYVNMDIFELFINDNRIDINLFNNYSSKGITPLSFACCEKDNIEKVKKILMRNDLDINHPNIKGITALMCAVSNSFVNDFDSVKLLLQHQFIDVNKQCNNGCTALHYICKSKNYENKHNSISNNSLKILRLLLSHPHINCSITTNTGYTAYHIILKRYHNYGYYADKENIIKTYMAELIQHPTNDDYLNCNGFCCCKCG